MSAILAVDGGGTRTRAGLYDEQGNLLAEAEGEETNLSVVSARRVVQRIAALSRTLLSSTPCTIATVCAGISGAGRSGKAREVATGLAKILGTDNVAVCSDAHMLSWANLDAERPILVIAGTGSVVITRRPDGSRVVTGGYGPFLGDEGSAHRLALEGIRRADEDEPLRKTLLDAAGFANLPQLFQWIATAAPSEIAALAPVVAREAERGNAGALAAIRDQAQRLASLTRRGYERAGLDPAVLSQPRILVAGGLMECELYVDEFSRALLHDAYTVTVESPRLRGHRAALEMRRMPGNAPFVARPERQAGRESSRAATEEADDAVGFLDERAPGDIARVMTQAESSNTAGLRFQAEDFGCAIDTAAACLRAGGRIIYAGAGTSGRLGVLDASECPPTFGVSEDRVIALIAGGDAALRHSIEGAEDDTAAAVRDVDAISPPVGKNDIVIGITASGTTPYALAAIDRAKALGAKTALVACNAVPPDRADIVIALDTGPEALPGSTRLKAGTATKIVLNQISTGAMAKAGYVFEGRMVGVRPLNKKLRRRCIRIIAELAKVDDKRAEQRLDETGGSIRLAVLMARRGLTLAEARHRLDACRGVLRDALEIK